MAAFSDGTPFDWGYFTEPNAGAALALDGRGRVFMPRGRMLGGSGAMNAMLYVHGDRRDFDQHWQHAVDATWNWPTVSKYYRMSERNGSPNVSAELHGFAGALHVEDYPVSEYDESARKALKQIFAGMGLKEVTDINGDDRMGYGSSQGTLRNGERFSSAKAFLHADVVGGRTNLDVIKMAHVTRVQIDGRSKRVTGVEFTRTPESTKLAATARKEVILAAGAINTPQLLMLSGIGAAEQLAEHAIPLVQPLPGVGHNFQDHIFVPLIVKVHESKTKPFPATRFVDHYLQYLLRRGGVFANLGSTDLLAFLDTTGARDHPNVQLLNFIFGKAQQAHIVRQLSKRFVLPAGMVDEIVAANRDSDVFALICTLLNPKSRGEIRLGGADAFAAPEIHANYLTDEEDVDTIVEAIELFYRSMNGNRSELDGELVRLTMPGCDRLEYASTEYWRCYSRHMSFTLYHPVGTAKMARASDESGVVDAKLNVRGVSGLRVADASIMPSIISGNTFSTTVMIGERAADFIKIKWSGIKTEL